MEVFGRFSASKDDPGTHGYMQHGGSNANWSVTMDGKEISQVVTADTDAGEILANELNEHGNVFVRGHEVARRTLQGHVRVFVNS